MQSDMHCFTTPEVAVWLTLYLHNFSNTLEIIIPRPAGIKR